MVVSVICWNIWRIRNSICLDDHTIPTIQNVILLICSLLDYWTGHKKRAVRQFILNWIPEDLDMVPIQSLSPLPALEMPLMSYVLLGFYPNDHLICCYWLLVTTLIHIINGCFPIVLAHFVSALCLACCSQCCK